MLTDFQVKSAKANGKPRKLADQGGLYLYVTPQGARLWRFDYRFAGKRKTASFGAYPGLSLIEARKRRDRAKELIADGVDPMTAKQAARARINGHAENSFETLARSWFEHNKARWLPHYAELLMTRFETLVFPEIGRRPITDIEPPELLEVIRKIENRPALDPARKMHQACGRVFRFAIAEGKAKRDPSRDLMGALTVRPAVQHRAMLAAADLPDFYSRLLDHPNEQVALTLELLILCLTRAEETCRAAWAEIEGLDGHKPVWRVPGRRMKMKREHLIPLSPRAVAVLKRAKELAGDSPYVFPTLGKTGTVDRRQLLDCLYALGYRGRATVHGFRRLASTVLHEKGYPPDWIEIALAHVIPGVRGIYNAALYLDQRRDMLRWWGEYLQGMRQAGSLI